MNYPFDDALEGRPWSRPVHNMFASLRKQCQQLIEEEQSFRLTPDLVLLGILQYGQQRRSNPEQLAGRLSTIANRTDVEFDKLLSRECIDVLQEGNLNPSIRNYKDEIKGLFESAEDIASKVGREQEISMRHLIAALLLPSQVQGRLGERCRLFQNIFPAEKFAAALVDHVTTSEHVKKFDQLDKWQEILRSLQSGIPADKKGDSPRGVADQSDAVIVRAAKPNPPVEAAVRLASEIKALEEKVDSTRDHAERDRIMAELNRKHAELDAALAKNPNEGIEKASMRVGGGLNLSREATGEEVCLRANDYAQALADFFTASKDQGEMCFALFGHWGRGKSFLMNLTGNLLHPRQSTPPSRRDQEVSFIFGFRRVLYFIRLRADLVRAFFAGHSGYEIIKFSAWKYPNIPEVWVHLYENFARLAYPKNIIQRLPRIFRAGISKRGVWQILVALAVLVFAALPKSDYGLSNIVNARAIDLALGVGSLAWLVALLSNVWNTTRRLSKDFLTAVHHQDKLGLQATIGEDLEALLHGWLPDDCPKLCGRLFWELIGVCYLIGGCAWWRLSGPRSGWFPIAAYSTIIVIGAAVGAYLLFSCRGPERVLLIVDDLDRCKPDQLLSVVESIKVLVETPEISRRIQVAMLVEEDVLEQAILKKYQGMRETKDQVTEMPIGFGWSNDRISRENMEKLFTAHLRLPPLTDEELKEVLSKLVGQGGSAGPKAVTTVPQSPVVTQGAPLAPVNPSGSNLGQSEIPSPTTSPEASPATTLVKDLVFTENDVAALNAALPELVQACKDFYLGPRSVRAFAFRFQLARLLLRQLSVEPDPRELAMGLAMKASQGKKSGGKKSGPPSVNESIVDRIIDQVA